MVTSCLSPCDLSCRFPVAHLSLCPHSKAWKGNTLLFSVVYFISELCLSWEEGDAAATAKPQWWSPVWASAHLTHTVQHPWDNTVAPLQCPSDFVHRPRAGDLADVPAQQPSHTVPCASGWPEAVPPASCPQAVLPFSAFFPCLGSYSLCMGCRAWVDLAFESWTTEHTHMSPL